MTNYDLISLFVDGSREHGACNHLGFKGNELFSYSTVICVIDRDNKTAKVNTKKYSRTTSKQVSILRSVLSRKGFAIIEYEGDPAILWNWGYMGAPNWKVSDFA